MSADSTRKSRGERTEELLRRREAAVPRGPFNVAPVFVERALGSTLWDVDGRSYLDFCGGIGVLNVGHNHPRVVEAIRRQLDHVIHTSWHVVMYEEYVRLAERLNDLVPIDGPCKTVFFNSGAEAVENAIKIARVGSGRKSVIALERGYHGRTLMTLTLTGKVQPYAANFGPFAPEVYRLPFAPFFARDGRSDETIVADCTAAFERLFAYHIEAEAVAALIVEPVLGEGGFFPLHPAAHDVMASVCRDKGILLIADEVQAGFARCGALFASEKFGSQPDLMVFAKSLAAGMPLSGVTGRSALMDAAQVGGLGGTYGGNPLACAAANAVLDIMADEDLPARARRIGDRVMACFHELQDRHKTVGDVRGLGAMCAIEFIDPATDRPDSKLAARIVERALHDGLLVMTASGSAIRTLMPLTIGDDELERGLRILSDAVAAEDL